MPVTDAIDKSVDTPPIQQVDLPSDLKRWFANLTDQINAFFGNMIADSQTFSAPGTSVAVTVARLNSSSVVVPVVESSTNPVIIQSVVSSNNTFTVTLSADPGASLTMKYVAFIAPLLAQGVQ